MKKNEFKKIFILKEYLWQICNVHLVPYKIFQGIIVRDVHHCSILFGYILLMVCNQFHRWNEIPIQTSELNVCFIKNMKRGVCKFSEVKSWVSILNRSTSLWLSINCCSINWCFNCTLNVYSLGFISNYFADSTTNLLSYWQSFFIYSSWASSAVKIFRRLNVLLLYMRFQKKRGVYKFSEKLQQNKVGIIDY